MTTLLLLGVVLLAQITGGQIRPRPLRIGSVNAPTRVDATKHRLPRPAQRVRNLIAILRANDVHLVGLQEAGTITRAIFKLHPMWGYYAAPANSIIGPNRIGNAVAWRKRRLRLHEVANLHLPRPKVPRRGLNMPVLLFDDLRTGDQLYVLVCHNPRWKLEPATNAACLAAEVECAAALAATGVLTVVIGDFNKGDAHHPFLVLDGVLFRLVGAHGVDKALVANGTARNVQHVDVKNKVGDHPVMVVADYTPRDRGSWVNQIPDFAHKEAA